MIITLTGASGTGKTTVARRILDEMPNSWMLTSYTTRTQRPNDLYREYRYLTEDAFTALADDDAFEWRTPPMRGKNYGTPRPLLKEAFDEPDVIRIMILVPETMAKLYAYADARGQRDAIRSFFIRSPAPDVLRKRLMEGRGLTEADVAIDVARCHDWEVQARSSGLPYIYVEDTDDLDTKFEQIRSLAFSS